MKNYFVIARENEFYLRAYDTQFISVCP